MTDPAIPSAPPAPKPSNTEVQKYIDGAMRKLEEAPESLEPYERRLLGKIKKASQAAQEAVKGAQEMKSQISQAEHRMRQFELQAESAQGSTNAYVDELVSVKFNLEEPLVTPKPPEVPAKQTESEDTKGKKLKAVKPEKD